MLTSEEESNRLLNLVNRPETQHQQTGLCTLMNEPGGSYAGEVPGLAAYTWCFKTLIPTLKPIPDSSLAP